MGSVVSLDAAPRVRDHERRIGADRVRTAFYFDLSHPGTYLAAERVDQLFPGVAWTPTSLEALRAGLGEPGFESPAERACVAERASALNMPLEWPEMHPAPRRAAMRAA